MFGNFEQANITSTSRHSHGFLRTKTSRCITTAYFHVCHELWISDKQTPNSNSNCCNIKSNDICWYEPITSNVFLWRNNFIPGYHSGKIILHSATPVNLAKPPSPPHPTPHGSTSHKSHTFTHTTTTNNQQPPPTTSVCISNRDILFMIKHGRIDIIAIHRCVVVGYNQVMLNALDH